MAVDSKSGSKDTKSIRKNKIESKVYCEQSTGDSSASNKSFVKQSLSKSNHESNVDNDIKKNAELIQKVFANVQNDPNDWVNNCKAVHFEMNDEPTGKMNTVKKPHHDQAAHSSSGSQKSKLHNKTGSNICSSSDSTSKNKTSRPK